MAQLFFFAPPSLTYLHRSSRLTTLSSILNSLLVLISVLSFCSLSRAPNHATLSASLCDHHFTNPQTHQNTISAATPPQHAVHKLCTLCSLLSSSSLYCPIVSLLFILYYSIVLSVLFPLTPSAPKVLSVLHNRERLIILRYLNSLQQIS